MLFMPNGVGRGIRTSLPGWVREVSQTGSLRMYKRSSGWKTRYILHRIKILEVGTFLLYFKKF